MSRRYNESTPRPAWQAAGAIMKSAILLLLVYAAACAQTAAPSKVILNLERSPYAKLHNVPVSAVTITNGFWSERRKTNVEKSIPTMLQLLEEHGIVDNFRRLSGAR